MTPSVNYDHSIDYKLERSRSKSQISCRRESIGIDAPVSVPSIHVIPSVFDSQIEKENHWKMAVLRCSTVTLFALFLLLPSNDAKSVPPPQASSSNRLNLSQSAVPPVNVSNIAAVEENISDFMRTYRKMRGNTSDAAMRLLVTLGLVSGALKVEDAINANLNRFASDMFGNFNVSTPKENMQKLMRIEEIMERDRTSVSILENILAFARNAKNFAEFQKDMQRISKEVSL